LQRSRLNFFTPLAEARRPQVPQVASERDGLDRVTVRLVAAEAMGRLQHPLPEGHYLARSRLANQPG